MRSAIDLRGALQTITEEHVGGAVGRQIAAVDQLRRRRRHAVRAIRSVDLDDPRSWRFNCHAYSLGYSTLELFWCLQESHPDAWPDSAFVTEYLLSEMVTVAPLDARDGDLVLYYQGATLTHSGVLRGELVASKWGRCHTWEHGLFEVPQSYGATVRYYEPVAIAAAVDALLRFADAA